MKKYFIHNGDEQTGPFSVEELKIKKISPDTHIWYEGLENWKEASSIEELKSLFLQTPPPFKKKSEKSQEFKNPDKISTLEHEAKKKSKIGLYLGIGIASTCAILLISFLIQKNTEVAVENAIISKELDNKLAEIQKKENEKKEIRNSFSDFISIDQSNYNADKFWGGITNLYYTANNNTNYKIDLIKLEVKYIRTNGGVFKTEIVNMNDIGSKSSVKIKAPDSRKGITVQKKILNIYSREMSFCYEAGDFGNSSSDPYKCNN
jgi:hypothetical protein